MSIIKTVKLTKYYGKQLGIKDLSFEVPSGSIFGFLGANGAGKTTTIRMFLGLLQSTAGYFEILGNKISRNSKYPEKLAQKIGFLPGNPGLYQNMTGRDFLTYMGNLYGRIDHDFQKTTLETMELSEKQLSRKISGYSRGMKQKIGVIQAIQHDPELIIMDEPTEGLDPLMQRNFYSIVKELQQKGKTIFFSSHNLNEVEKVCLKVAIIRQGRLITIETIDQLKSKRLYNIELVLADGEQLKDFDFKGIQKITTKDNKIYLHWKGNFADLFAQLSSYNIKDFHCQKASLEEIFLTYYSQENDTDE